MTMEFKQLKNITLKSFRTMQPVLVEIVQSDKNYAEIWACEKDMKKLDINNSDDSLSIGAHAFAVLNEVKIAIYANDVEYIKLDGSVKFCCSKTAKNCKIALAGSVSTQLSLGEMDELKLTLAGANKVYLSTDINTLDIISAGSSKVILEGSADKLQIRTSGSAKTEAESFNAKEVEIDSSGSGKHSVWAGKTLQMSLSGSGSVDYLGNPELKDCNFNGAVKITKH